jgi:phytoene synthase
MPPPWPEPGLATPADLAACRALLRTGSRSFFTASLLLPHEVRAPACSLYAFCRLADDAIDLGGGRAEALARLRERLARAYEGRPWPAPVDRAFADVVARFAIPRALPEALFEGFEWDARGRRYQDLAALHAYAARVAGTVGAMMAMLMGVRAPEVVARACDLGVAMQLSNIARDVGEDARAGRLYLPLRWLEQAGLDPEAWLARPVFSEALGSVVQRVLTAADLLYQRADAGIARLPLACRPAIYAARLLYAEIGHALVRQGLDPVGQRTVVPASSKAWLLARALTLATRQERAAPAPPLDAVRFLVDAVAGAPPPPPAIRSGAPWWQLGDRVVWLLDLFERLERLDRRAQAERSGGGS